MSYRKRHIRRRLHAAKSKKPLHTQIGFWIFLLSASVVGLIGYFLFFYPGFYASAITVEGNSALSAEVIEAAVKYELEKPLFKMGIIVIPAKNMLLVSTNDIQERLLADFPRLSAAKVKKRLPRTISVSVRERDSECVYCEEAGCFLMDANGVVFEKVSQVPDSHFIVRRNGADPVAVGSVPVPPETITFVFKVSHALNQDFSLPIFMASMDGSNHLTITSKEGWKAYFALGSPADMDLQLTKLKLLLSNEITEEKRKFLSYIDLRFKGRAYYQ